MLKSVILGPGASPDSKIRLEVLKRDDNTAHGPVSEDDIIGQHGKNQQIQKIIGLEVFDKNMAKTLFLFLLRSLHP